MDKACDLPDGRPGNFSVQPSLQKYLFSRLTQITSISLAVPSPRGALAIVIDAGRDAVDAAASGARLRWQGGFPVSHRQRADERR
jgi:hypothetical protein